MTSVLAWFGEYSTGIAVLLAALPILGAGIQFILVRRTEEKRRVFETYHGLIKQLVQSDEPGVPPRLDRQIAVIFELRHFKLYFSVSLRILRGLRTSWAQVNPPDVRARLMEEIDLAIEYIEKRV